MGIFKHAPGCPCCDECKCLIDSFTDAVDVTDKDSKTIRPTLHPQHPYPAWLRAEIELDPGNVARLYFAWDDSDPGDGFYIEITPQDGTTKGTLKLFRKGGTQIGDTLELLCALPNPDGDSGTDLWHRVTACYDPDEDEVKVIFDAADERGWIIQNQELAAAVPSGFAAGRQAGYGTGSGHTGTVSFRSYRFERLWYCEDEQGCTEDCPSGYYYYDPPERTVCRTCGGCTIVDEDFSGLPDGDMPCGWDSDGTNWEVSGGAATGDGQIDHMWEFPVDRSGHQITADFKIGTLANDGDSVTVSVESTDSLSAKLERLSSMVFRVTWTPSSMPSSDHVGNQPDQIILHRTERSGCVELLRGGFLLAGYGVSRAAATGAAGVSITQPTGTGSEDAALQSFTIRKTRESDPACDPQCSALTCTYCRDSEWPTEVGVMLDGFAPGIIPPPWPGAGLPLAPNFDADWFNGRVFYLTPGNPLTGTFGGCASGFCEENPNDGSWPSPLFYYCFGASIIYDYYGTYGHAGWWVLLVSLDRPTTYGGLTSGRWVVPLAEVVHSQQGVVSPEIDCLSFDESLLPRPGASGTARVLAI